MLLDRTDIDHIMFSMDLGIRGLFVNNKRLNNLNLDYFDEEGRREINEMGKILLKYNMAGLVDCTHLFIF